MSPLLIRVDKKSIRYHFSDSNSDYHAKTCMQNKILRCRANYLNINFIHWSASSSMIASKIWYPYIGRLWTAASSFFVNTIIYSHVFTYVSLRHRRWNFHKYKIFIYSEFRMQMRYWSARVARARGWKPAADRMITWHRHHLREYTNHLPRQNLHILW